MHAALDEFIAQNQPKVTCDLKREIREHFNLKKFSYLPVYKETEAIKYAERIINLRLAVNILDEVVSGYLHATGEFSDYLAKYLRLKLREEYSDKFWAKKTPEEAMEFIRTAIGNTNIWEFTFKPT